MTRVFLQISVLTITSFFPFGSTEKYGGLGQTPTIFFHDVSTQEEDSYELPSIRKQDDDVTGIRGRSRRLWRDYSPLYNAIATRSIFFGTKRYAIPAHESSCTQDLLSTIIVARNFPLLI
jgi:hypothetical protein